MSIPDQYKVKDSWPHVFARGNNERILKSGIRIYENYCTHCYMTFWPGVDPRPTGSCPARSDKKERKRLIGE